MSLSKKLRQLRESQGITGTSAAKAIGFSPTMLSRIEAGASYPSADRLAAMAQLYGADLLELQAEEAADKGRLDIPPGVSREDVVAAVFRLAGKVSEMPAVNHHAFNCPCCGERLIACKS